jgi:hypothetical protein
MLRAFYVEAHGKVLLPQNLKLLHPLLLTKDLTNSYYCVVQFLSHGRKSLTYILQRDVFTSQLLVVLHSQNVKSKLPLCKPLSYITGKGVVGRGEKYHSILKAGVTCRLVFDSLCNHSTCYWLLNRLIAIQRNLRTLGVNRSNLSVSISRNNQQDATL